MRVVLCDDHPIFVEGLKVVVGELLPASRVETAPSLEALRRALATPPPPELLLLDVTLPDGSGLSMLPLAQPDTRVLVVSSHDEPALMRRALGAGARGYLPKSTDLAILRHAIALVMSGGTYIPAEALTAPEAVESAPGFALTHRQREVMDLVLRGLTNREMCTLLGISENTIKTHLRAIFRELDVTNRTEAATVWLTHHT